MNITEITKQAGAHRKRTRVGRGEGSGLGKTSGRGHKGAKSRSGAGVGNLTEGGMFPFFRRIPKVGFNNVNFRTEYQVVNLSALEAIFENGSHVTPAVMEEKGLIRRQRDPVKVLGDGELKKKLTIEATRFSKSAEEKIGTAGGMAKWLGPRPKKKFVKRPPAPAPAPATAAAATAEPKKSKKKDAAPREGEGGKE